MTNDIKERLEKLISKDCFMVQNAPLPVRFEIIDSFSETDRKEAAGVFTSMETGEIVVQFFIPAIADSSDNLFDIFFHECIHVEQFQRLYKKGGWKLLKVATVYEQFKYDYEVRPCEIQAYSFGRKMSYYQYLEHFDTEEFKQFYDLVDYYDDDKITFKAQITVIHVGVV